MFFILFFFSEKHRDLKDIFKIFLNNICCLKDVYKDFVVLCVEVMLN